MGSWGRPLESPDDFRYLTILMFPADPDTGYLLIASEPHEHRFVGETSFKTDWVNMSAGGFNTEERLEKIESALAHLQHDVDTLNASLTEHFRRLRNFEDRFTRIEHELETRGEGGEERDAELEKPPHY